MFSKKKQTTKESGTAVWINEVGSIQLRIFKIIKKEDNKAEIDFGNNETYMVNSDNIRGKRVLVYKLANGKIKVQNPNKWKNLDLKKHGIKELRFNLQNFALQEGKASIHRWTIPPDRITKLSPLFKLLMICIAIGVMAYGAMKFGTYVLDVVMKSRLLPCSDVLPKMPAPIGAVVEAIGETVKEAAPIGT
jgi:hypothetical protein